MGMVITLTTLLMAKLAAGNFSAFLALQWVAEHSLLLQGNVCT